ncbi:hypothetical protein C8F01DRAFT_1147353 [Mycena amicta]|nr:hypothetical protein C8F01DRAFT_1147353 [Mycena amicta]
MKTHSLRRRLEEMDADIASFRTKITELASARRIMVEQLNRATYAVLELPVEITSHIFLEYTQDQAIRLGDRELNGPFVLASVCRHWRSIAIRLDKLWTQLNISGGLGVPFEVIERRLELCLERAGKRSNLDIDCFAPERMLPFLIASAAQWSTLQLHGAPQRLHWTRIRGRLARLRKLKLWDYPTTHNNDPLTITSEEAPMLMEVELVDVHSSMVSLPWAQLKTLALYYHGSRSSEDCLRFLRQTPNIETLNLRIPEDFPRRYFPELRLKSLRTLTLEWSDSNSAVVFMHLLAAPALVDLTIDICHKDVVFAVAGMLLRSKCGGKMRSLTVKTNGGYIGHFANILEHIPFLEKLSVTQVAWDQLKTLFGVFLLPRGDSSTLPTRIRHLHLEPVPGRIPYPEIASFVSARTQQTDPEEREQAKVLAAAESLRRMAASPGGPEISIGAHKNFFLVSSSAGLPPPPHTLSDL